MAGEKCTDVHTKVNGMSINVSVCVFIQYVLVMYPHSVGFSALLDTRLHKWLCLPETGNVMNRCKKQKTK